MKQILTIIILCAFVVYANVSVVNANNQAIEQAERRLNEARLLEQYTIRFIIRIRDAETRFPNIDSLYIENTLRDIETILQELDLIQRWQYSLKDTERLLENILLYLKTLNQDLQERILMLQQENLKEISQKIKSYENTVTGIHTLIWRILEIESRPYINQEILNNKDRAIIQLIRRIRNTNIELKLYNTKTYKNAQEVEMYLRWIIHTIRKDIWLLTELRVR